MEQLELIVVQLEEAKGMIEKGRVAHLRLAFILLDSVTELILHRTVQSELWDQEMLIGLPPTYKQFAAHGSAEAAAEAEAIAAKIIPNTATALCDRGRRVVIASPDRA
jgi:hypothetical protein